MPQYDALQPDAADDLDALIENSIAAGRDRVRRELELSREAYVRELIKLIEGKLSGEIESEAHVDDLLAEIIAVIDEEEFRDVLRPGSDLPGWARASIREVRRTGEIPARRERLFRALVHAAKALGFMGGYQDKTRYAPVVMETLDMPGASSEVQDGGQTPIGRRRLAADSTMDLEDAGVEIPHKDCEHIMVVANPRQGKDSTICRICGNLKREHGYKWISIYDDGRHETPMIALPNEDPAIHDVLDAFDQEPRGYETTVWVPATDDLPERLPANHEPFAISIDTLDAELVAHLAGEEISSESTQRRIQKALTEARQADGSVEALIERLQTYAQETTAEVRVEGLRDEENIDPGAEPEEATHSYHMGEDELLGNIAESLMLLAAEGLLRDTDSDIALDMREIIADQSSVAVLNANVVNDSLKYLLTDLWLQLIYRARDEHPRLPRVALEVRELKELAPSKLGDSAHSHIVKSLQQTFFFLSSQGGSRRILILGSTQKVNDVYKPVRGNMPIKILLQLGPEKISTLENAGYSFTHDQREELREMPTGWGMLLNLGDWTWPIQWCGAQCGLGIGDIPWRDRYGEAAGYRVASRHTRPSEWIDVTGERVDDRTPDPGEWYLRVEDVEEAGGFAAALQERRDERVASDLRLRPIEVDMDRNLELLSQEAARERLLARIRDQYDFPKALESWLDDDLDRVDRYLEVLRCVRDYSPQSYNDMADLSGISSSTIANYFANGDEPMEGTVEKIGGTYHLTQAGARALEFPWRNF